MEISLCQWVIEGSDEEDVHNGIRRKKIQKIQNSEQEKQKILLNRNSEGITA